jgi:hypothetical protein
MTPVSWPGNLDVWNALSGQQYIELHPNNMNREESFSQRKSWKPLSQTLEEQKKALSKEK